MKRSKDLYEQSRIVFPGGVSSPVRAFEPYPFFVKRAKGSKIYDVDGQRYLDYCLAYGPLILGHANPRVASAVRRQLSRGTMYGAPTEAELDLARMILEAYPSMDMIRFVNSGTEATMHAIRLARGFTKRLKIVKFEGCYHGAHDYVLVKAGSGAATFGVPTSLGIPDDAVRNTIVIPYNNTDSFKATLESNPDQIACTIIEPVVGNAGVIPPRHGYLKDIASLARKAGVLLIVDEVITGFRLAYGGAQELYSIRGDITTLGKIMGGGFPLAAYGGRKEIMEMVSPLGKVYQAATYAGNPVSVVAGLETLRIIRSQQRSFYPRLERSGEKIEKGVKSIQEKLGLPAQLNRVGSMFQLFFNKEPVTDYEKAIRSDRNKYAAFHQTVMRMGVYLPPSQFETCFISSAHADADLEATIRAFEAALA